MHQYFLIHLRLIMFSFPLISGDINVLRVGEGGGVVYKVTNVESHLTRVKFTPEDQILLYEHSPACSDNLPVPAFEGPKWFLLSSDFHCGLNEMVLNAQRMKYDGIIIYPHSTPDPHNFPSEWYLSSSTRKAVDSINVYFITRHDGDKLRRFTYPFLNSNDRFIVKIGKMKQKPQESSERKLPPPDYSESGRGKSYSYKSKTFAKTPASPPRSPEYNLVVSMIITAVGILCSIPVAGVVLGLCCGDYRRAVTRSGRTEDNDDDNPSPYAPPDHELVLRPALGPPVELSSLGLSSAEETQLREIVDGVIRELRNPPPTPRMERVIVSDDNPIPETICDICTVEQVNIQFQCEHWICSRCYYRMIEVRRDLVISDPVGYRTVDPGCHMCRRPLSDTTIKRFVFE